MRGPRTRRRSSSPTTIPSANPTMAVAGRHSVDTLLPPIAIPRNTALPLWLAGNTPRNRSNATASTNPVIPASSTATAKAGQTHVSCRSCVRVDEYSRHRDAGTEMVVAHDSGDRTLPDAGGVGGVGGGHPVADPRIEGALERFAVRGPSAPTVPRNSAPVTTSTVVGSSTTIVTGDGNPRSSVNSPKWSPAPSWATTTPSRSTRARPDTTTPNSWRRRPCTQSRLPVATSSRVAMLWKSLTPTGQVSMVFPPVFRSLVLHGAPVPPMVLRQVTQNAGVPGRPPRAESERSRRVTDDFAEGLDDDDRAALATCGQRRQYPRGAAVFHEGDHSDFVVVILEGRLKVVVHGLDGTETLLSVRGPGAIVGELAGIDDSPRLATARSTRSPRRCCRPPSSVSSSNVIPRLRSRCSGSWSDGCGRPTAAAPSSERSTSPAGSRNCSPTFRGPRVRTATTWCGCRNTSWQA